MLKKIGNKIYDFFSSPITATVLVRALKVSLFSICVMWLGPWIWANKLDAAITENSSYLEFLCATLLSWIFIQNMLLAPPTQKKRATEDEWFVED